MTVQESATGPFLLVEPHDDIGLANGQRIVMHLLTADIEEARKVAAFLNQNIARFKVERF